MSSPGKETDGPSSTSASENQEASGSGCASASTAHARPPAKRRLSNTVIEISDTESDDSDVCAVNSYQASADEVKRIRGSKSFTLITQLVIGKILVCLRGKFKILFLEKVKKIFNKIFATLYVN